MKKTALLIILIVAFSCTKSNRPDQNNELIAKEVSSENPTLQKKLSCKEYTFDINIKQLQSISTGELIKQYNFDNLYMSDGDGLMLFLHDRANQFIHIIDLCKGKSIFSMDIDGELIGGIFHISNRYFIRLRCNDCQELEVWEIEMDLERLEAIDLSLKDLGATRLKSLPSQE